MKRMIGCKFNKIKSCLRKTLIIIGDDKRFIIRWVYEVRGIILILKIIVVGECVLTICAIRSFFRICCYV